VFWDRFPPDPNSRVVTTLLAHVLVHEITHLIERIERHSEQGIMKAQWTATDIRQMSRQPLPFDPSDLKLIHLAMMERSKGE
jgi:hypothetical protein